MASDDEAHSVTSKLHTTRSNLRLASFEPMVLASILMLGFLHRLAHRTSLLAIMATIAILLAAMLPQWSPAASRHEALARGAVIVSIILSVWGVIVYGAPENFVTLVVSIGLGAAILWTIGRLAGQAGRFVRLAVMLILVGTVLMVGHLSINQRELPPFDTYLIHQSAAEEIIKGENPYVTASAPNTYLFAPEGAAFEGYVYPPTTLAWFAGSDILFGDSRWASVVAVSIFVTLLVAPWSRMSEGVAASRMALALVFVAMPQLGIIIHGAWTDLIALPFLLGAAFLWKKYPISSAVLLGLALSTKPYFLPVLPLLLLWPYGHRIKRLATVGVVVIATYVPFLILDVPSIVKSLTVGDVVTAGVRPDSLGLAGLGINVPRWMSAALALVTAVMLARRGGSTERFFIAMAAVLSVVFVTGFQVFLNYWFLIVGLSIIALAVKYEDAAPDRESEPSASVGVARS